MRIRVPKPDKGEAPLKSLDDHARALELARRAAAQIVASSPEARSADLQEPLPASTVALLRRLPRCHR